MARFRRNPRFIAEIRKQQEHKEALREGAEAVQEQATDIARQAGAPWMRRQAQTIEVQDAGDEVAVVNTDYAGHLMEWGSIRNTPHAPLRRGARAAGLHFRES